MKNILYLLAGGGAGTVARHLFSELAHRLWGKNFPYGTFLVNILGCLILGVMVVLAETKFHLRPGFRMLLIAGFCGAFTTFSTFIFEISHLVRDGHSFKAFIYLLISVSVGFVVFRAGIAAAERFV